MEITKEMLDKTLTSRLQRTGEIEQVLFDMANGKLPLPSQQDCRVMALRLGTPKAEWSEQVKEHKWEGHENHLRQVRADAVLDAVNEHEKKYGNSHFGRHLREYADSILAGKE